MQEWNKWAIRTCPVSERTIVEVSYYNESKTYRGFAKQFDWSFNGINSIEEYRVLRLEKDLSDKMKDLLCTYDKVKEVIETNQQILNKTILELQDMINSIDTEVHYFSKDIKHPITGFEI